MKKIALFSMLTFSVLSLSLAGCGNKKTASTNDSKPKQETKKATQKSSSQQEMKSSHSSVTGQNSNVTGKIRQKMPRSLLQELMKRMKSLKTKHLIQTLQLPMLFSILKEMKLMVLHYLMQPLQQR